MGFIPFVRILLRNQRSNKAATFGSMFGVLISIAFITGSFMTSDAVVSDLFHDQLDEVNYHFKAYGWGRSYSSSSEDLHNMMDDVREHEGIDDAGLFVEMSGMNTNDDRLGIYGLDDGAARFLFEKSGVELPDDGDSCIITFSMAEELELSVGDAFNITYYEWIEVPIEEGNFTRSGPAPVGLITEFYDDMVIVEGGIYEIDRIPVNISVNVSAILDTPGMASLSSHIYTESFNIFIGLEGADRLEERIREETDQYYESYSQILFKLDPDYFSNIDDVPTTRREARQLKNDLQETIRINNFYIEDDRIDEIYENYIFWSISMRVFLVILSLPLFLLCFYLVLVGSRIGMENKLQEISLLKVKGATRGQVFWMLMLESFIHASVGTLFGIIAGTLLSVLFIIYFLGKEMPFSSLIPSGLMIVTLLFISCILVTLIRLRAMNRLSKMDILQAVRGSPERKEKEYKPLKDIVIVTLVGIFILVMSIFNEIRPEGLFQLALYSITEVFKPILILFLPFLLILSGSRLLVLGIPGSMDIIAKPFRSINRELHSLLISGLKYRKRSVAIMAILISITVSFGILVLSQMETRENGIEASFESSVPTDLYVAVSGANEEISQNISSIDGVDDVVTFSNMDVSYNFGQGDYGQWGWGTLVSFDAEDYREEISPSRDLLVDGKWIDQMDGSADGIPVIVNSISARENDLVVGDRINVTLGQQWMFREYPEDDMIEFTEKYLDCRIIGIVDHLPGLRSSTASDLIDEERWGEGNHYFLTDLYEDPAIYLDSQYLPESVHPATWSYLVDINGKRESVKENITMMGWKGGYIGIADREEDLEDIKDIPANRGMDLMLIVQFSCILIAVVVGLFLMQVVQNTTRRREFAEILARGATRDNIFKLLLSEGLVILIAGLVIGTFTGFLVGYAFQTIFTGDWATSIGDFGSGMDVENRISVDNGVVFPWTIMIIHLVTIGSMVLAIYLVSRFSSKIDIASNLRMRRS